MNGLSNSDWEWKIEEGTDLVDIEESRLPYTLLGNLGKGGYGVVDKVHDTRTGQTYARKVLFLSQRKNTSLTRQEFRNEISIIRAMGRRQHHHIVRVFATYTTSDRLGIILSPVASDGDLDSYIGRLKSLMTKHPKTQYTHDIEMMRGVLKQAFGCLLDGLRYIHQSSIRHKDIKPNNILIHQGWVVYTDFGLSLDSSKLENSMTDGLGRPKGRFSAPEVIDNRPRNSSSDVFSLGCVLVEILAAISTFNYDDNTPYVRSMPQIRKRLKAFFFPWEMWDLKYLVPTIRRMTTQEPDKRCTASVARDEIARSSKFICEACKLRIPNPDMNITPLPQSTPVNTRPAASTSNKHASAISNAVGSNYTPWEWSQSHNKYYSYLIHADGSTILETLWSTPSAAHASGGIPPPAAHVPGVTPGDPSDQPAEQESDEEEEEEEEDEYDESEKSE